MQKNQKILTIIIGTTLLVSILATGTSASPMVTGKDVSPSQPFTAQFPAGSAGISCSACHGTKLSPEDWTRSSMNNHSTYLNLYNQILYTHTSSHTDASSNNMNLSQGAIYTILTYQPSEQSIRLESDSEPIVQCSFCHTELSEHAAVLIGESD